MRHLIIGCGYVGSRVAERLQKQNLTVEVTTTSPERLEELQPFHPQLLRSKEDLHPLVAHADWILLSVAPKKGANYRTTYLDTAKAVLEGSPRGPLVYISSTSVYGDYGGKVVTEETPVSPLTSEAEILVKTEELLLTYPETTILRLGEILGPGRELEKRVLSLSGKTLPGIGENLTNLSPIDLILEGVELVREENLRGVYNLVSDLHVPRRELYEKITGEAGLPPPQWDPTLTSRHGGNKCVSGQKMKTLISAWKKKRNLG